jgi:hypothetical protein
LFSQAAGIEPLDAITNRAFHFAERVMALIDGIGPASSATLKELIRRSSRSFFIRAAGEAGRFYTKDYLVRLETCSPFRFSFLEKHRKRLAQRKAPFEKLFEAFLDSQDDEPGMLMLPSTFMPGFSAGHRTRK